MACSDLPLLRAVHLNRPFFLGANREPGTLKRWDFRNASCRSSPA